MLVFPDYVTFEPIGEVINQSINCTINHRNCLFDENRPDHSGRLEHHTRNTRHSPITSRQCRLIDRAAAALHRESFDPSVSPSHLRRIPARWLSPIQCGNCSLLPLYCLRFRQLYEIARSPRLETTGTLTTSGRSASSSIRPSVRCTKNPVLRLFRHGAPARRICHRSSSSAKVHAVIDRLFRSDQPRFRRNLQIEPNARRLPLPSLHRPRMHSFHLHVLHMDDSTCLLYAAPPADGVVASSSNPEPSISKLSRSELPNAH